MISGYVRIIVREIKISFKPKKKKIYQSDEEEHFCLPIKPTGALEDPQPYWLTLELSWSAENLEGNRGTRKMERWTWESYRGFQLTGTINSSGVFTVTKLELSKERDDQMGNMLQIIVEQLKGTLDIITVDDKGIVIRKRWADGVLTDDDEIKL